MKATLAMRQISDRRIETYSPLDSSFIVKMSWFEDGNILMLTFNTGSIWAYYNVPFEVYSAFCKAPSYGKYFNSNIRNAYPSERVNYVQMDTVEV
jgi:lysyl-tRNA synthetase class 2